MKKIMFLIMITMIGNLSWALPLVPIELDCNNVPFPFDCNILTVPLIEWYILEPNDWHISEFTVFDPCVVVLGGLGVPMYVSVEPNDWYLWTKYIDEQEQYIATARWESTEQGNTGILTFTFVTEGYFEDPNSIEPQWWAVLYHHKNVGDLNKDGKLDFNDIDLLSFNWLDNSPELNIKGSDVINLSDYAVIANYWLSKEAE